MLCFSRSGRASRLCDLRGGDAGEAEGGGARFEARAADIPGLEGLATLVRARIVAHERNKERAAMGMPLLDTCP